MKSRTWAALAAVVATGLIVIPLTACITVVKKPAEEPKPEPKPAAVKPAEGTTGR